MIITGNQPYFMPYIGYWQLIHAADVFIIGDDYNYIKKGWVSRNRILQNGEPGYFNIEVSQGSSYKKIMELSLSEQYNPEKKLRQLAGAYRKAPYFDAGYALMKQILEYEDRNLANYLEHSLRCVCDYLDITTKIVRSSSFKGNDELKREYRIFDMCCSMGADTYINPIGGVELYDAAMFRERGIKLGFIQSGDIQYQQFGQEFVPWLSIIDLIMFNSKEELQKILNQYTILWGEENTAEVV